MVRGRNPLTGQPPVQIWPYLFLDSLKKRTIMTKAEIIAPNPGVFGGCVDEGVEPEEPDVDSVCMVGASILTFKFISTWLLGGAPPFGTSVLSITRK